VPTWEISSKKHPVDIKSKLSLLDFDVCHNIKNHQLTIPGESMQQPTASLQSATASSLPSSSAHESTALRAPRVFLFDEAFAYFNTLEQPITSLVRQSMKDLLGGKGAGLAEMGASGVNVPPGLTITTSTCRDYYDNNQTLPEGLMEEVFHKLKVVEAKLDRELGNVKAPLLLSVRSGAKFSMPGMMDTILNLGLNDQTVLGLAALSGNERFAWDSYRRFIQMYSSVVLELSKELFEQEMHAVKAAHQALADSDLNSKALQEVVTRFKEIVLRKTGKAFPTDTHEQLTGAIEAVFRSWNNPRAIYYRNLNKIDHNLGTAVTVQSMVFGNLDENSGTGVCFTRNPATGEKLLYGEYLTRAQGEDVVAGIATPKKIAELALEMPAVYEELLATVERLERHYRDMQDIEFTIEQGRLFILQTRTGKRNAQSAVRVAVEMAEQCVISINEALCRVEPSELIQLLLPSFSNKAKERAKQAGQLLAVGLNASPGAAIGEIVFDPDVAAERGSKGDKVILLRIETCPDDIHGMVPAQGIVTARGGMTSHAAVVARGMGKPCVAGCESFKINLEARTVTVSERVLQEGDLISIDGATGEIFAGVIETENMQTSRHFKQLLDWADERQGLGVRANADTPEDAKLARNFGAVGIGLCRTEHMFMAQERLPVVQRMILADTKEARQKALDELLPMQREDFTGIFIAMNGLPVTIRLLDPPLHEFLPNLEELIAEVATLKATRRKGQKFLNGVKAKEALLAKVRDLHESNPMMGRRGCRLGLVDTEINIMQVRAIFEAAVLVKGMGYEVLPEIMIPLVGHVNELKFSRLVLEKVARDVMEKAGATIDYKFGTMIEVPRAAVTADEIAQYAEFFSFGTNDLTQMTFGYSRDDAEGKFLNHYLEGIDVLGVKQKVLAENPFAQLDQAGVGKLMQMAVNGGKSVRPDIKLGICGEHGGDPSSIAFAYRLGLNYVSCSPYRVPIARLAACQAAIVANGFQDK
jgi:pyruvate,orthophosphate dikinase